MSDNFKKITLSDEAGNESIILNGSTANLILGGNGQDGDIAVKNEAGQYAILMDGHSGDIRIMGRYIDPADFVFDTEYPLPQLDSVSQFVADNKHLPGIPSGNQMKEQGLSLTNFSMRLLQKVEELTLYVIQQNDRIKELEQKVK